MSSLQQPLCMNWNERLDPSADSAMHRCIDAPKNTWPDTALVTNEGLNCSYSTRFNFGLTWKWQLDLTWRFLNSSHWVTWLEITALALIQLLPVYKYLRIHQKWLSCQWEYFIEWWWELNSLWIDIIDIEEHNMYSNWDLKSQKESKGIN